MSSHERSEIPWDQTVELRNFARLCDEQAQILRDRHDRTVHLLREVAASAPSDRSRRMSALVGHVDGLAEMGLSVCAGITARLGAKLPVSKRGSATRFGAESALGLWAEVVTARLLGQVEPLDNATVKSAYHSLVDIFRVESPAAWAIRTETVARYIAPHPSPFERSDVWAPCARELARPGEPATRARRPGKLIDLPSEVAGLVEVAHRLRDQADRQDPRASVGQPAAEAVAGAWSPAGAYTTSLGSSSTGRHTPPVRRSAEVRAGQIR